MSTILRMNPFDFTFGFGATGATLASLAGNADFIQTWQPHVAFWAGIGGLVASAVTVFYVVLKCIILWRVVWKKSTDDAEKADKLGEPKDG